MAMQPQRQTRFDLENYILTALNKGYDKNGDGLSMAELQMFRDTREGRFTDYFLEEPTTGKCRCNVRKADPNEVTAHLNYFSDWGPTHQRIEESFLKAAGDDGRVTRAEARALKDPTLYRAKQ